MWVCPIRICNCLDAKKHIGFNLWDTATIQHSGVCLRLQGEGWSETHKYIEIATHLLIFFSQTESNIQCALCCEDGRETVSHQCPLDVRGQVVDLLLGDEPIMILPQALCNFFQFSLDLSIQLVIITNKPVERQCRETKSSTPEWGFFSKTRGEGGPAHPPPGVGGGTENGHNSG